MLKNKVGLSYKYKKQICYDMHHNEMILINDYIIIQGECYNIGGI